MKIGEQRTCDVCGAAIPKGRKYKVSLMDRAALEMFLSVQDPDLQPRWQEVGDGSGRLRMDICLTCNASMTPAHAK